jgi:hypothetical protein
MVQDGVGIWKPRDWVALRRFFDARIDFDFVIWRGQRRESWPLESTIERLFKRITSSGASSSRADDFAKKHLDSFKYACRGRRGAFFKTLSEDEWWSLGQHFGLDTPLLDWTASPYVGLFFAFAKPTETPTECRILFGLKHGMITSRIQEMAKTKNPASEKLEIVRPMTDENPRLVSQNGLFTKIRPGTDIEEMVKKLYRGEKGPFLYKILIPETQRYTILKALNRMNINYLSLFPDLTGASLFTNHHSEIPKY